MAKADIIKFMELLISDADFQEELKKAAEAYSSEQSEKAVFDNLLLPFAEKYGLSGTYEEFGEYLASFTAETDRELSEDELAQIAGGKGGGLGICRCVSFGVGIGGGGTETDCKVGMGLCILTGAGIGYWHCAGSGECEGL